MNRKKNGEVTEMEKKLVFDVIDELYPDYLLLWEKICNMESPTLDKERVDAVGDLFLEIGKKHGWVCESFESENGNVVCLTMNPSAEKEAVSLSGHMDTVFPVGTFGSPAVRTDRENIYGPGVIDCKGGLVMALLVMDALERVGYRERPIRFLLQSNEESGSGQAEYKTIEYICQKAKDSLAFFNLEGIPTWGDVCVQRKGILTYAVTVTGVEAHSAACAEKGANAIAEAAHKIIELEKFKDKDGITCNCGVISGGTVPNTVPGRCEFFANFRFATDGQLQQIRQAMLDLERKAYVSGCKTEIEVKGFRPAMEPVQRNLALLDRVNEILSACGMDSVRGVSRTGGSDAAQITVAGIPCLDSFGVVGGGLHSTDEYANKESLRLGARRLASVLVNL